jgi:glyoxylase-like metal-dependent hydrolase (beta-lactamase superfamily II)
MQPMALQPVRGTKDVSIFPYIRKIDLMSSNSYILSSPKMISVIDPGGLEDQIEHLEAEVARLQEAKNRPVVVYLTHVHLDHWIQYQMSSSSHLLSRAALAVHEAGARALEEQDSKITLSGLLGRATVKVPVPIKLLSDKDKARENRGQASWHSLRLDGWTYDYARSSSDIADDLLLDTQTIALGDVDLLDIYHTPGHSPDSICMRVGSLMFLGDLFFAPNPGMAGAYGWSRQISCSQS